MSHGSDTINEMITERMITALKAGTVVLCDRFTDSTIAYQSYGRKLPLNTVLEVNNAATGGLKPDLTILIDVPVSIGFGRKGKEKKDRFEEESLAFYERVRGGYLRLAETESKRFLVIDGTRDREDIARTIWDWVKTMLQVKDREL